MKNRYDPLKNSRRRCLNNPFSPDFYKNRLVNIDRECFVFISSTIATIVIDHNIRTEVALMRTVIGTTEKTEAENSALISRRSRIYLGKDRVALLGCQRRSFHCECIRALHTRYFFFFFFWFHTFRLRPMPDRHMRKRLSSPPQIQSQR